MRWHVDGEDIFEEEDPGPPTVVIKSGDGSMWFAPEWTPPPRGTSAPLGPEWKQVGYMEGDGLRGPEKPHVPPGMIALQNVVNRALSEDMQRKLHPAFFEPVTREFTFDMLEMDDQVRDLFLGAPEAPPPLPPLDGPSAALLGQECTHDDYWRAWQKWPEEMQSMELTRHYGAFRQRYACGVDYIAGP